MAATTASVQVLKQNENKVSLKFVGATGPEVNALLVDASSFTGATGVTNLLSITQLDWVVNGDESVTLQWAGATGVNIVKLSRSGTWMVKRNNNVMFENNATSPSGDILITATTGTYTLLLEAEKVGPGWYKEGQYRVL